MLNLRVKRFRVASVRVEPIMARPVFTRESCVTSNALSHHAPGGGDLLVEHEIDLLTNNTMLGIAGHMIIKLLV